MAITIVREEVNHEVNDKNYAILFDAKSALARICRERCLKERDPISLNIKRLTLQCKKDNLNITLMWIPSRAGITRNR